MAKSETANGGGNGLDGRGLVSEVMPGGEPLSNHKPTAHPYSIKMQSNLKTIVTGSALEEQLWLFVQQMAHSDEESYSMIEVLLLCIAHVLRIIMDWIQSGSNMPFPWHNVQDTSEYGTTLHASPILKQAVQPPPSTTLVSGNIQQQVQPCLP
ncbi:hypothetical protein L208DRAFT_1382322 [Tricholoma matsutake]|nr:hypothetical protein L208DRAFT_1382322 [Tricholoma matsutake 945]